MSKAKRIKDIEHQYDVASISYKNLKLWSVLRYYICVKYSANKSPVKPSYTNIKYLLKSFFYGLRYYFSKSDYLFISSSDQRKSVNGRMVDKSIDEIVKNVKNSWVLELPANQHSSRSKLLNKKISSKIPLILCTRIYAKFIRKSEIENEKTLNEILKELNTKVDVYNLCKRHYAEYRIMKFLAKRKKFKAAFVVCHYTNMGYIKALRELNIPVIEIQHGMISRKHCAYNLYAESDTSFYPNYLLTYGGHEKSLSKDGNQFINEKNIIPVGHAYLEYISSEYSGDERLKKIISAYKFSVGIVSQNNHAEAKLIDFIKKCANENSNILFIFIPRTFDKPESSYRFPENVILYPSLNVYETIWHVDIHSTMFSTLALEAPALGKPNILINIENLSKEYLGDQLTDEQVTRFVDSTSSFSEEVKEMSSIPKEEIIDRYGSIIKPGYKKNIEQFVNEYINHK